MFTRFRARNRRLTKMRLDRFKTVLKAGRSRTHLVRFIEQAHVASVPKFVYVIVETAIAKFVRLNVFHADDGLLHNATVPVPAVTFFS